MTPALNGFSNAGHGIYRHPAGWRIEKHVSLSPGYRTRRLRGHTVSYRKRDVWWTLYRPDGSRACGGRSLGPLTGKAARLEARGERSEPEWMVAERLANLAKREAP